MNLKKRKILIDLLLVIPAAVMILSLYFQSKLLGLLGLALAFGYGVVRTTYWRCPHCNGYLGKKTGKICPVCKKPLNL